MVLFNELDAFPVKFCHDQALAVLGKVGALIFAAGHGIPLAGVVYDPKVSAFLRYIGQNLFSDLGDLTEDTLKHMVDQTVAQTQHPEAQAAAVKQLQALEHQNTEVARRLLEL